MTITLYIGEPRNLPVVFPSDPLVPHGYTYADIDDISMCLKQDCDVDADDKYLQKLQSVSSGVVLDSGNHTFTMVIGEGDYPNVTPGYYELVLACQVNAPATDPWVELRMEDPSISVLPDKHRT